MYAVCIFLISCKPYTYIPRKQQREHELLNYHRAIILDSHGCCGDGMDSKQVRKAYLQHRKAEDQRRSWPDNCRLSNKKA